MKISEELLLEDSLKLYLSKKKAYNDTFNKYMLRYNGDEELVRSLVFPMEYSCDSAELNFYKNFFKLQKNQLALMRYLYEHLAEEFQVPLEGENEVIKY